MHAPAPDMKFRTNVFTRLLYTYHTLQFANQIGGGQKGHKVLMVNVEVYPGSVEGWLAVDWKTAHESAGLLALKEVKGWAPLTEIEKKITALMDKVMLDFVRELVHHQTSRSKKYAACVSQNQITTWCFVFVCTNTL